jgi:uncharacterized protein (TIGR03435 family)
VRSSSTTVRRRASIYLLAASFVLALPVFAQQSSPAPTHFAVATIKPSASTSGPLVQIRGNRFATENTTVLDVFKYAWNIHPDQLVGGPPWLRTEKFDILADPETEKRPTSDQMKLLVQQLLIERFHLATHSEQKVLPVYALVRTSEAPRLTPSTADPNGIPAVFYSPIGKLEAGNATMANLATFLQRFVLDRPAVDQTGIEGHFDITLRFTPDNFHLNGVLLDPGQDLTLPPGLFTAIKEQLGLKLQATKAPTNVFIVDHIDHPTVD